MFHIILYQPEIPPNTGNIIRLCANTGMHLHLIRPLGFTLDDKRMRRAGLDYHEWARLQVHDRFEDCLDRIAPPAVYAMTTKGSRPHTDISYQAGDALLLGPETRGLPPALLDHPAVTARLRLPMVPGSRSLNLSNAAAVVVYEAWRQAGFPGAQS